MFRLLLGPPGSTSDSFASDFQWYGLTSQGSPVAWQHVLSVEFSSLNPHGTSRDLFVVP